VGVSQTLVSLWEQGTRAPSPRRLTQLRELGFQIDPAVIPLRSTLEPAGVDFAQELANLGYPGFVHCQNDEARWNPAQLLVLALAQNQLDRRVAEALPWLAFHYWDINWEWVSREARLQDLQNRLGFTLLLARLLAAQKEGSGVGPRLYQVEQGLRRSLLAKEDTYCNQRMTEAERRWLHEHRSQEAATWNLLSDLRPEHLKHGW
jgi:transcriptional regulator with XRE-family HTH domain